MTRYYSHTFELAATNAVALLPSVTGTMGTTRPTQRTRDELLFELIEDMTTDNWRDKKEAALAMLSVPVN